VIRAWIRLVLVGVWCLLALPLPLIAALLTIRRPAARVRARAFLNHGFARGICVCFGVRTRVTGPPPPPGAFVAPNHWSYIDVFVLSAAYRGVFVSRADVRKWPVFGYLANWGGGTLFIDRAMKKDAARVRHEIEDVLRVGCRVTAFLEGGAGPGTSVAPFKSSLLGAAAATGTPCVPVALLYELPKSPGLDPTKVIHWDEGTFVGHASGLMRVPRIVAHVTFLPPRTGNDRKALARALEADVAAALIGDDRQPPGH
jgi:1-acyl-sn-glycerol-3-phosphate acyltransferase